MNTPTNKPKTSKLKPYLSDLVDHRFPDENPSPLSTKQKKSLIKFIESKGKSLPTKTRAYPYHVVNVITTRKDQQNRMLRKIDTWRFSTVQIPASVAKQVFPAK